MTGRFQLIRLTYRRTLPLFLASVILAWLILPLIGVVGLASGDREGVLANLIYGEQALLPVGGLLWAFAYLQMWVDSEGEETMRACRRGKYVCAAELLMLTAGFAVMLLPVFAAGMLFFGPLWGEYARLTVQVFFFTGAFYLASILLHSVSMSGMLVLAYHLFCVFFCRSAEMQGYCLVRPDRMAGEVPVPYMPLILVGAVMYLIGMQIERKYIF